MFQRFFLTLIRSRPKAYWVLLLYSVGQCHAIFFLNWNFTPSFKPILSGITYMSPSPCLFLIFCLSLSLSISRFMSKIVYQSLPFNCHRIDLLSQNINIYQQALVSLHIAIMYICFTVILCIFRCQCCVSQMI